MRRNKVSSKPQPQNRSLHRMIDLVTNVTWHFSCNFCLELRNPEQEPGVLTLNGKPKSKEPQLYPSQAISAPDASTTSINNG